jgi:hypothetical protein
MADNIKRVVRIVALVQVEAPAESDIGVIGGNLARQLQGAIPTQYDVRGVEVEGITDPDAPADEPVAEQTTNTSRAKGERDGAKTLTT